MDANDFGQAARKEADVLIRMRGLDHPHLIKAIAYYTSGRKHFIMFPWAGEGNLRDFWETDPPRKLDGEFLSWAFGQFCGLAGALDKLHSNTEKTSHSNTPKTCRHGDLKPENILCFENKRLRNSSSHPVLVIADVGLAKVHDRETVNRSQPTRTSAGTVMYEPPEAFIDTMKTKPRSRRYDIWSMGCIYLEFLIWMLYGKDQLDRFGGEITSKTDRTRKFFEEAAVGGARIKPDVKKWIEHMMSDPRCLGNTATRRLVELIYTRLLVVNLEASSISPSENVNGITRDRSGANFQLIVRTPTGGSSVQGSTDLGSRASASEMFKTLKDIVREASNPESHLHWMNFQAQSPGGPGQFGSTLAPSQGRGNRRGL